MSVLIKGLHMPAEGNETIIRIQPNGTILDQYGHHLIQKAIYVPPHMDLIDRDALWVQINKICDRYDAGIITDLTCLQQLLSAVRHAPTVLQQIRRERDDSDTRKCVSV